METMTNESNGIRVLGIRPSIILATTLILVVLKLADWTPIVGLSWLWILSPVLIYFGLLVIGIMIIYVAMH